jgi:RNA polymerase sigma-70 factor, ECF subfamily
MSFSATIAPGSGDPRTAAVSRQTWTDRSATALAGAAEGGARAASVPAFAAVFESYASYVLGLLPRLGLPEADVQDVAQEVFLAIAQGLAGFEGRSSLKTWVCGICLRKASDHRRKLGRRRERIGGAAPTDPIDPSEPQAELLRKERVRRLNEALATLPEKQLQVFVLYEIEELEMAEVARAVGCPRFTAYTRLRAARAQVRAFFAQSDRRPR